MPFKITPDISDNLWQESKLKGAISEVDTGQAGSEQATLPYVGKIQNHWNDLQDGLWLDIQHWEFPEDLLHTSEEQDDHISAGLAFYLSGKVQTDLPGLTGKIEEIVGYYDLTNCSGIKETELWKAGKPFW